MADHLSSLQLDEASAGLPAAPEVAAHLGGCAACAARLEQLSASRAALLSAPESARRLTALLAAGAAEERARPGLRRMARWAAAAAVPLAAAVAFFVLSRPDAERLKGTASIEVLADSGAPLAQARVGQHVTLAVGGAGYRRAAVVAVDPAGKATRVWPPAGAGAAPIGPGARVRLEPGFEVTPGAVTLYAFFTDGTLDLAALEAGVEASVARGEPEPPRGLAPASARLRLEVTR